MGITARRLGKYELLERVGRGGMAEVWKAFDRHLKRFVAIKILHANLQDNPSFVLRFEREAQAVASLYHPNIIHIHDFSVAQPTEAESPLLYMVMQYVQGSTLADFIERTAHLGQFPSSATIVQLFTPISSAIDYAHQKGMIHRDIKPSNILLDEGNTTHLPMGEPILSDFGIVKLLGGTTGTLSGWWLGTPRYTAPEQVMGEPGTERSDIYALGVMLYELCTGVPPFQGTTPAQIMLQHLHAAPPAPQFINPAIPSALTGVILRALAKDPAVRFPTAPALLAAVAEACNLALPPPLSTSSSSSAGLESPPPISLLTPRLLPGEMPSSGALPGALPSNPLLTASFSALPLVAAANSGQGLPGTWMGKTPESSALSPSSAPLPGSAAVHPSVRPTLPVSPSSFPAPSHPAYASPPTHKQRRSWLIIGLSVALTVAVLSSWLGVFFLLPHSTPPIVGHTFFLSSGQGDQGSSQGIMDEVQIDLSAIPAPSTGKSYYGWLEPDLNQTLARTPLLLGPLPVTNGHLVYLYRGDAHHTNLLATMSRLLITEEDAAVPPHLPSADPRAWRYWAQFPQPPGSMHASENTSNGLAKRETLTVLDQLRALLAQAPELKALGLPGGEDLWLLSTTEKILECADGAREDWQTQNFPQLHGHIVRILDYLDGLSYVQQDAPGEPVYVTSANAKMGLLDVDPRMQMHGLLHTVDMHLKALIQSPDATPEQRLLATKLDTALKQIETWLTTVRKEAQQLEPLLGQQLAQTATRDTLLEPMATAALSAFTGRLDPQTGTMQEGVVQIHDEIQHLATFDVHPAPVPGAVPKQGSFNLFSSP